MLHMTNRYDLVPAGSLFARLRDSCAADWQAYVTHEFVRQLGDGSLPEACFRHYLAQLDRVAGRRLGGALEASERWASLTRTLRDATRLEIGFWDMGLAPGR